MNTLTSPPLAELLQRLFAEAEATRPGDSPALADLADGELDRLMRSKTEYREFYGRLRDLALPVSRETGSLLYMLARSSSARHIVEFGTSFGLSTLHLAAALRDNGGGHLAAGGLQDLVELREGDALQTLASDLPASIDLVLLDGAKALYPEILALLENRLRPGALVIADNAEHSPEYLAHVRSPTNGYLSIPFAEDVELSMRLG
ncbi:class I SAM-dependent methyltransferase [Pseudomonas aeruginosa]|nr:class I SAM-dependent methyltransferase [Pseudomonas aeruginosa]